MMMLALNSINGTFNEIVDKKGLCADDYTGSAVEALGRRLYNFFVRLFAAQNLTLTKYSKNLDKYEINDELKRLIEPYIISGKFPTKKTIQRRLKENDPQMIQILEEFISQNFTTDVRKEIAEDLMKVAKEEIQEALDVLANSINHTALGGIQLPDMEAIYNDFKYLPDKSTKTIGCYYGLSQQTVTILKFLMLKEQIEKTLKFMESTRKSFEAINNLNKI